MIVDLAMHGSAGANQGAVVSGDFHQSIRRIDPNVDISVLIIDVERMGVEFAFPTGRRQQLSVHEHHVVVEPM